MEDFEERIEEINTLYSKATTLKEYKKIVEEVEQLRKEMSKVGKDADEISQAIIDGFWAHYYLERKFYKNSFSSEAILQFAERVQEYYRAVKGADLKVSYGYLLSVILGELREDSDRAEVIAGEIQVIAKESGNTAALLRQINARGIKAMKEDFEEAVKIFNEIENVRDIHEKDYRHVGNIINNSGASKIRGDIDIVDGMKDLLIAADYYLAEEEPPIKHLEGIINRLNEGIKKLKGK